MDDVEFLRRFESAGVPRDEWTHRAHVKVAFLYLSRHPFAEALQRIRAGIKALNAIHKTPETTTRGYNETTTRAFLQLIAAVMRAYGGVLPTPSADSFCDAHPELLTPHVLRLYYSPARRLDPRAKTEFVEPDLAPLPRMQ